MTNEYRPMQARLVRRPVRSWTDCVELAEAIWAFWEKDHRDGYYVGPMITKLSVDPRHSHIGYHQREAIAALVEGVLTLGGGERFDPRIVPCDPDDREPRQ